MQRREVSNAKNEREKSGLRKRRQVRREGGASDNDAIQYQSNSSTISRRSLCSVQFMSTSKDLREMSRPRLSIPCSRLALKTSSGLSHLNELLVL